MAFAIHLTGQATRDLKAIRLFDQRRIVDAVNQRLRHQATLPTRNRKCLEGVVPDLGHEPPLWELRCGTYRVFYDIDEANQQVHVRAIRRKEHGQTTEDVIHERDDS